MDVPAPRAGTFYWEAHLGRQVSAKITARHQQLLMDGVKFQQSRQFAEAQRRYRLVLDDDPTNPDALNLMGTLALEARKARDAIRLFQLALAKCPAHAGYLRNLGVAFLAAKEFSKAASALNSSLLHEPGSTEALYHLATAQKALNQHKAAVASLERAHALQPNSNRIVLALADILVAAGDLKRARDLCRVAIAKEPRNPMAYVGLAAAHEFQPEDAEPAAMRVLVEELVASGSPHPALMHATGKALSDLAQHDDAFAHFASAKEHSTKQFDFSQLCERHDAIIARLDRKFFSKRTGYGCDDEAPVFIVGMPRSGTTLVEQICSSHSEVFGAGELDALGDVAVELGAQEHDPSIYPTLVERMSADQSRQIADIYNERLAVSGSLGSRITDKMPHNFEQLGLIALLFPNARVIHCMRDPIDNCVSCFTHHFNENHGYNTDLAVLGQYYREYRRIMEHWRAVLPIRMLDFSYEALIADQEGKSRELIEFLGLQWEDACLDFHKTERLVKTPSRWQVRQPIYASSVKGWKKYEAHLGPLFDALGDLAVR